jgi:hypothetical protein
MEIEEYESAGLDIAHIFMPGDSPAFSIAGRDGVVQRTVAVSPGPPATDLPLAVLVNSSSASASEIVAGALHDSGRARLVGDSETFGKGRIQAVFDLDDGSALFVTVATYQTPRHAEIDHVGIKPDLKCTAPKARVEEEGDVPIAVRAVGVWEVRRATVDLQYWRIMLVLKRCLRVYLCCAIWVGLVAAFSGLTCATFEVYETSFWNHSVLKEQTP